MPRLNWTEEELLQLLGQYCEIPFGKMHARNPDIIELAQQLNRTPNAVALKMVNFASLDPTVEAKGMSNVSRLDREVWEKFFANIDLYLSQKPTENDGLGERAQDEFLHDQDFSAHDIQATTTVRQGQGKFRKIVLASYENKCAISGLKDERLLIASHIAPWATERDRRLDPRNGICLNALWDKAFDRGLVALSDNLELLFASQLSKDTRRKLEQMGTSFSPPTKFNPDSALLAAHRTRFGFNK